MMVTSSVLLSIVLTTGQPPLPRPPLPPLPPDVAQKLEATRQAASVLASYPADVRRAILEVAQYPKLVAKLDLKDAAANQKTLAEYPDGIQLSARLLLKYPQTLAIMQQDIPLTALVGTLYSKDKEGLIKLLDALSQQQGKQQEQTTTAWSQQLQQDDAALMQLKAAAEAFAAYLQQQQGNNNTSSDNSSDDTEPYYSSSSGSDEGYDDSGAAYGAAGVVVNGVPSGALANYVLHNADRYGALSQSILQQYWRGNNPASFNRGVDQWWSRYQGKVPAPFFKEDGQLAQRLGQLAKVDNGLASQLKGKPITGKERSALLDKAIGSSGLLKQIPQGGPPIGKPPVGQKPPMPAQVPVKMGQPNPTQFMQRAQLNHAATWQGMPGGTPRMGGPKMGGPPHMGGPRPGPGPRP